MPFCVLRRRFERQVVAGKLDLNAGDVGCEDAKRLLEKLLSRLVSFENDNRRRCGHERDSTDTQIGEILLALLRTDSITLTSSRVK